LWYRTAKTHRTKIYRLSTSNEIIPKTHHEKCFPLTIITDITAPNTNVQPIKAISSDRPRFRLGTAKATNIKDSDIQNKVVKCHAILSVRLKKTSLPNNMGTSRVKSRVKMYFSPKKECKKASNTSNTAEK
jgi:hypothetical protein